MEISCAIVLHPNYGHVSLIATKILLVNGKIRFYTRDNNTAEFLSKWFNSVHSAFDTPFRAAHYKATLLLPYMRHQEYVMAIMYGVWPINLDIGIDADDISVSCEGELVCDKIEKRSIDDNIEFQNFDIIFRYISDFARNFGVSVDVSGSPMFQLRFNNKSAYFELSGRIVYGDNKSHIADPKWEDDIARWLGVAT